MQSLGPIFQWDIKVSIDENVRKLREFYVWE